jgi:VanZ family protein
MPEIPSRWGLVFWLMLLAAWTAGLLMPEPHRQAPQVLQEATRAYLFSKLLHVVVYAGLAATAGWLPGRAWWWIGLLVVHAPLGEWLQSRVPSRTGTLTDVGIDLAGIALGVVVAWWVSWRR